MRSYLGGLPADQRQVFTSIFEYLLGNLRVGLPENGKRASNLQWYRRDGVTPATANQEFSIQHGLSAAPAVAFPALDLTSSGTQLITLTCARPADASRIYLKSASTSAAFMLFVEGK